MIHILYGNSELHCTYLSLYAFICVSPFVVFPNLYISSCRSRVWIANNVRHGRSRRHVSLPANKRKRTCPRERPLPQASACESETTPQGGISKTCRWSCQKLRWQKKIHRCPTGGFRQGTNIVKPTRVGENYRKPWRHEKKQLDLSQTEMQHRADLQNFDDAVAGC